MYTDRFEARVAKVRHRFATALESKITDAVVFADRKARGEDRNFKRSCGRPQQRNYAGCISDGDRWRIRSSKRQFSVAIGREATEPLQGFKQLPAVV